MPKAPKKISPPPAAEPVKTAAPVVVEAKAAAPAKPAAAKPPITKPAVAAKPKVTKSVAAAPKPVVAEAVAAKPVTVAPAPVKAVAPKPVAPKVVAPKIATPETVVAAAPKPAAAPAPPAAPKIAAPKIVPDSKSAAEAPAFVAPKSPASTSPTPQPIMVKFMSSFPTGSFKGFDEFTAFSKANIDAMVKANQVLAKGIEEFSKEVMSLTQTSMETAATATKAVMAAKTLKDVMELNKGYTKSSFDKFVADSTKLSELGVKVATEAFAPVSARVTVAVEKIMKPTAA